jgi:5-methylcytosine-specific restriction endonuclease McrA
MTTLIHSVEGLCDRDLLAHLRRAAATERRATAELIALLMEMDARRLYLAEGCSSLFTYCTQVLHLSEHAAYGRIEAARAARRFAAILARLSDGSINLTTVGLLAPHLTPANHLEVLDDARHKSKREVEQLVAQLNPKPDVQSAIRKLPHSKPEFPREQPRAHTPEPAPRPRPAPPVAGAQTRPADVKPLGPERYKIQFTVGRETYERLRRVQDLTRHTIPNGDPGIIFDRALTLLHAELSKTKFAATDRPRAPHRAQRVSRHIPSVVKREVWQRDGGRCAFSGTHGRCVETGFLEFHHVVPFAEGGETTSRNVELRCRAHNAYEADQWFGPWRSPLLREQRSEYSIDLATRRRAFGDEGGAQEPESLKSYASDRCVRHTSSHPDSVSTQTSRSCPVSALRLPLIS